MSKSNYLAKKHLDESLGGVAYAAPATVYVALFTDSNTDAQHDADTKTEVPTATWSNYARVAVTNNTTNWPSATGTTTATKSNGVAIDYGTATASGTVNCTAFGIYDALTGGNLMYHGLLTGAPIAVQNGNPVKFNIGALTIVED